MADVLYEVSDGTALMTLNRPQARNALTVEAVGLIARYSREAEQDDRVRAVVVTGAGDEAFCAGGDLGELIPELTAGRVEIVVPDPTKRFFSDVFKPVLAAVNGTCVAGGLELMLGTDIRVASERAVFGLPEVRWGLIPGAGSHTRLPDQVPWAIALQMLLTGETLSAKRAHEVGLVNDLAEPAAVLERTLALAERIAANGALAVRTAKEIAVRARGHERGFVTEAALNDRVLRSEDAREGPRAFVEGREPRFRGA